MNRVFQLKAHVVVKPKMVNGILKDLMEKKLSKYKEVIWKKIKTDVIVIKQNQF